MTVPGLVTLHLWTVPRAAIPVALARMALDPPRVRRLPGVTFAKLLGTGDGRTFTVRDATPTRWGLLACWSDRAAAAAFPDSPTGRGWDRLATESWRADLVPLASRGRWSRRSPFGDPTPVRRPGPVVALTRARIALRWAPRFWRAVPPVSADLHATPGLLLALGVGEAPIGLQGTFSLWESDAALREFAHRRGPHVEVVRRTAQERWYAEELFARFHVAAAAGTLDGRDPLAAHRPALPTTTP